MEKETRGGEPKLSYRTSSRSRCSKAGSRVYYMLLAILFFLMMTFSVTSLGLFTAKHDKIDGQLHSGDAKCILYTTKDQLKDEELSSGVGCRFTIWGSGIVALATGLFMFGYVIKAVYGSSLLSCLVCMELPLLILILIASLSLSINTTLGLALTCMAFNDYNGDSNFITASGSECKNYAVTSKKIKFFDDILISETMSWAVTGALVGVVVLYCIQTICYCKRCNKNSDESSQALLEKPESKPERPKRPRREWRLPSKSSRVVSEDSKNNPFL